MCRSQSEGGRRCACTPQSRAGARARHGVREGEAEMKLVLADGGGGPEPDLLDDDLDEIISELDPAYSGPPSKAEAYAASAFPRGVRVDVAYRDALELLPRVQKLDAEHAGVLSLKTKAESAYDAARDRADADPAEVKRLLDRFDEAEAAVEQSDLRTSAIMREHGYGGLRAYHATLGAYSRVCLPAAEGTPARPRTVAARSRKIAASSSRKRAAGVTPPTPAQRRGIVAWLTTRIKAHRERKAADRCRIYQRGN